MILEQLNAMSGYVPYLSFSGEKCRILNEQFIIPRVNKFFNVRSINQDHYAPIDPTKYISDLDFSNCEMVKFETYFYDNILFDISKDNLEKFHYIIKYCITFDEEVTSKMCEITQIKYDEILLNKKPTFYFLYIDLKEIISFSRTI
jgi:hypothetical protein